MCCVGSGGGSDGNGEFEVMLMIAFAGSRCLPLGVKYFCRIFITLGRTMYGWHSYGVLVQL